MTRFALVVLFLSAVVCASCTTSSNGANGAAAADSQAMDRYRAYVEALGRNDMAVAREIAAAEKRAQIASMNDSQAHSELSVLSPLSDLKLAKETINGDQATLIVKASAGGEPATGRIKMVRENGQWHVLSEMWNLGGDDFPEE